MSNALHEKSENDSKLKTSLFHQKNQKETSSLDRIAHNFSSAEGESQRNTNMMNEIEREVQMHMEEDDAARTMRNFAVSKEAKLQVLGQEEE